MPIRIKIFTNAYILLPQMQLHILLCKEAISQASNVKHNTLIHHQQHKELRNGNKLVTHNKLDWLRDIHLLAKKTFKK